MTRSIRHLVAAVLGVGAAALVLAACGGSSGGSNTSSGSTASGGTGLVSVQKVNGTNVLTDSQGRTLYSANVEKGGTIHCTGMCTSFWKPIDATAKQSKTASSALGLRLGVVSRGGGQDQLTFKGQPLYSFTQESAGMLNGNGFKDAFGGTHFQWTAAATGASAPTSSSSGSGGGSSYY